jgi:pimeloyl-ACP methyl ester carboxylesterase
MLDLLVHLGCDRAIWVGHDWGSAVVWGLASHHSGRCDAVASLCVPYVAYGFALANLILLVERKVYPQSTYPAGQWEYWRTGVMRLTEPTGGVSTTENADE